MFKRTYDTTAGSIYYQGTLPGRLLVAKAEGTLTADLIPGIPDLYCLVEKSARTDMIPTFFHLMKVQAGASEAPFYVIDLRPYRSQLRDAGNGRPILSNEGTVGHFTRRALLEMHWDKFGGRPLLFAGDVPIVIFARWIGGLLRSRFNLNEESSPRVQVFAAYYYMCLHLNKEDFTADSNKMLAVRIARALRLPAQKVIDWLAPLPYLANLDDFCNIALVKNSGTVALSGIDRRVLWAMTGTGWFGSADTKEVLAASLEFPPAFVSMVYTGTTDRLARKAALSQLIEREGRNLGAQAYCQRIDGLIRELKIV
ncbi:hypothetical protein TOTORO_00530 [Serratia phage vB_SmaS-Totoro]|nr:hypothetical protein TOTORO_00530 [Serratia phage vB_SmaS-Totoro]